MAASSSSHPCLSGNPPHCASEDASAPQITSDASSASARDATAPTGVSLFDFFRASLVNSSASDEPQRAAPDVELREALQLFEDDSWAEHLSLDQLEYVSQVLTALEYKAWKNLGLMRLLFREVDEIQPNRPMLKGQIVAQLNGGSEESRARMNAKTERIKAEIAAQREAERVYAANRFLSLEGFVVIDRGEGINGDRSGPKSFPQHPNATLNTGLDKNSRNYHAGAVGEQIRRMPAVYRNVNANSAPPVVIDLTLDDSSDSDSDSSSDTSFTTQSSLSSDSSDDDDDSDADTSIDDIGDELTALADEAATSKQTPAPSVVRFALPYQPEAPRKYIIPARRPEKVHDTGHAKGTLSVVGL